MEVWLGFLGEEVGEKVKKVFLRKKGMFCWWWVKGFFENIDVLEFFERGSDSWVSDLELLRDLM